MKAPLPTLISPQLYSSSRLVSLRSPIFDNAITPVSSNGYGLDAVTASTA
jgi:hypothetical protein